MKYILTCFLILFILSASLFAQNSSSAETELREYLDLQMHPAMHMTYSFFGKGFRHFSEDKEPRLSYKHQFKDINFANYWEDNPGARIIVTGALNKEGIRSPKKARKNILKQIKYVNDFAKDHSDKFAVAKSPQELRELVSTTDKTIIVHSIEGARRLVNSQEDADFWAAQGVAFMTVIHLRDTELGSAAIKPGFLLKVINYTGALKRSNKRGGLTELGKQTIRWLACAGIMSDLTHMSDQARTEALDFMEQEEIPPIVTHDLYRPLQNHPRGITKKEILKIYQNQGFISLPISGISLMPYQAEEYYQTMLDTMSCYCDGSVDTYRLTYEEVQKLIESNFSLISGNYYKSFNELTESEKVRFSIGFQSDFNGWLNHSRPRYGKEGCFEKEDGKVYEKIELDGMPHPGYLESQWRYLENEGVDLSPIKRNAEQFTQLWARFLERKCD